MKNMLILVLCCAALAGCVTGPAIETETPQPRPVICMGYVKESPIFPERYLEQHLFTFEIRLDFEAERNDSKETFVAATPGYFDPKFFSMYEGPGGIIGLMGILEKAYREHLPIFLDVVRKNGQAAEIRAVIIVTKSGKMKWEVKALSRIRVPGPETA